MAVVRQAPLSAYIICPIGPIRPAVDLSGMLGAVTPSPAPAPEPSANRDEPAPAPQSLPATSADWLMMLLSGGTLSGAGLMLRRKW